MRKGFLEKLDTGCGVEASYKKILNPFIKKSKLSISLNQWSEML